jgi:hypothetical protein
MWRVENAAHRSLKPYATAIGQTALAWNALHDDLASLFWMLLRTDDSLPILAIWNAIDSDRLQRKSCETPQERSFVRGKRRSRNGPRNSQTLNGF